MKIVLGVIAVAAVAFGGFLYSSEGNAPKQTIVQLYDPSKPQRQQLYNLCVSAQKYVLKDHHDSNLSDEQNKIFKTVMRDTINDRCDCRNDHFMGAADKHLLHYDKVKEDYHNLAILSENLKINGFTGKQILEEITYKQALNDYHTRIDKLEDKQKVYEQISAMNVTFQTNLNQCLKAKKLDGESLSEVMLAKWSTF